MNHRSNVFSPGPECDDEIPGCVVFLPVMYPWKHYNTDLSGWRRGSSLFMLSGGYTQVVRRLK